MEILSKKTKYIKPLIVVMDVKLEQNFLQITGSGNASGFQDGGSF